MLCDCITEVIVMFLGGDKIKNKMKNKTNCYLCKHFKQMDIIACLKCLTEQSMNQENKNTTIDKTNYLKLVK